MRILFVSLSFILLNLVSLNAKATSEHNTQVNSVKAEANTINVSDFGAVANDQSDTVMAVRAAIEFAKKNGSNKLVFPKGRYDFYPTRTEDVYAFVSNNDEGLKRVAFNLAGMENFELDGQGSEFMFHGKMNPFIVDASKNITLRNFSIDFSRTFHQEAKILAVGKGSMDLHISEDYPFKVTEAGILVFTDRLRIPPGYAFIKALEERKAYPYEYESLLEYDPVKRETAYMVSDLYFQDANALRADYIGDPANRDVRIYHPRITGTPGNIMTFAPRWRNHPGFFIKDSADVLVDGVTIHHANGMGIIGERCHNVTVQNSKVTPSGNRIVSTTADATHFVNCTGKLHLIGNLFENQKDDATNIHGVYAQIDGILDDDSIDIRMQHPHQYGFDFVDVGDTMELVNGASMSTITELKVISYQRVSKEITRVKFSEKLPDDLKVGDSIAEVRDYPEVVIRGNTVRRNRARGMLLNSRGKTIVEDNYFHSPGAAILFEGDANFWFEQGGVSDLTIRNNVFDNSVFGVWGNAVLDVAAGISDEYKETSRYNRNILIENNTFNVYDKGLILDIFSVQGLIFRNNRINLTDAYPPRKNIQTEFFNIEFSDDVVIEENNIFNGF